MGRVQQVRVAQGDTIQLARDRCLGVCAGVLCQPPRSQPPRSQPPRSQPPRSQLPPGAGQVPMDSAAVERLVEQGKGLVEVYHQQIRVALALVKAAEPKQKGGKRTASVH